MTDTLLTCDIEKITADIIKDYYGDICFYDFPIDIRKIAEEYLKLNIIYDNLSDDGRVLGVTAYQSTQIKLRRNGKFDIVPLPEKTALIEEELLRGKNNIGRHRFTVAHECSHQILYRLFRNQVEYSFRIIEEGKAYTARQIGQAANWSERKANELAAALLMPVPMLKELTYNFSLNEIKVYGGDKMIPKDKKTFSAAADFTGVSRQALLIRLKQFKFLDMRPISEYPKITGLTIHKEDEEDDENIHRGCDFPRNPRQDTKIA